MKKVEKIEMVATPKTKFIAFDGQEFEREADCRSYELALNVAKVEAQIERCKALDDCAPFDGGENYESHTYRWYKPKSKEDIELLCAAFGDKFDEEYMRIRKKRKPRGFKKTGQRSYDMCPYCYHPGCDPMAGSPKYQAKIHRRLDEGKCPACSKVKCTCKSSVLPQRAFEEREKSRLAVRCRKCVYDTTCQNKENAADCKRYKRDAPDGGYYG